jgi:hypothetical protein
MGCCLRKRKPSSCLLRRQYHRRCSASVICWRRLRAACRRSGGTGVGVHTCFSPLQTSLAPRHGRSALRASPHWGEISDTALSIALIAFLIGDNVYYRDAEGLRKLSRMLPTFRSLHAIRPCRRVLRDQEPAWTLACTPWPSVDCQALARECWRTETRCCRCGSTGRCGCGRRTARCRCRRCSTSHRAPPARESAAPLLLSTRPPEPRVGRQRRHCSILSVNAEPSWPSRQPCGPRH